MALARGAAVLVQSLQSRAAWSAGAGAAAIGELPLRSFLRPFSSAAPEAVQETVSRVPSDADGVIDFKMRELGKRDLKALRKEGYLPGTIVGMNRGSPRHDIYIAVKASQVQKKVNQLQRHNIISRVFYLKEEGKSKMVRVVPKQVHITAVSDVVENMNFQYCRPGQLIPVNVPVTWEGGEASPGIKRGGYINAIMKTIRLICRGDSIPEAMVIDISKLDMGNKVALEELELPAGCKINPKFHKDISLPVLKMSGKIRD